MAERERKEVRVSVQFDSDIQGIYLYGTELFGPIAAKSFIADDVLRIIHAHSSISKIKRARRVRT